MKKKSEQNKLAYLKRLVPCEVCGMSSSGRHYGAFSCEGCRNFFKRSLVAHPFYSCRHSPDTVSSNCKLCRFNACLAAGMSMAAVRVGRPTADERAAVSAYLTQLETQKRLLPEPLMRKRQRRKSSLNATGMSSSESTMDGEDEFSATSTREAASSTGGGGVDNLMIEFERRIVDAARAFNAYYATNNGQQIVLDWQMTPQIIWSLLVGNSFDAHITATADFTRNLPGFSKVAVSDRVVLFAWSLFPLVAARCFYQHVANNNGVLSPEQVAFDAICDFFSLERSGTSWQIAKELLGEPLRQLESVFIEASRLIAELKPSDNEFALIYALCFFANDSESPSQLEDSRRAALIGNVYTAISEAMAERFHLLLQNRNPYRNHYQQMMTPPSNNNDTFILSGKRRCAAFNALVKLLRRTTELIASIQQQTRNLSYQCGTNINQHESSSMNNNNNSNSSTSSFFFGEIMKIVLRSTSPLPSSNAFNNVVNTNYQQPAQRSANNNNNNITGGGSEVTPTYYIMTTPRN